MNNMILLLKMAHEYSNEYKRRAQEMNISIDENKFYGYVYDGIWAIALALHQVDYKLKYYNRLAEAGRGKLNPEIKGLKSLLDFDYHKPIWVKLIRSALNRTKFDGVTVSFTHHLLISISIVFKLLQMMLNCQLLILHLQLFCD